MSSTLLTHRGSLRVNREQLSELPTPEQTDTFKPVRHDFLVEALTQIVHARGFSIIKEEFCIQQQGHLLSGVLDFTNGDDIR